MTRPRFSYGGSGRSAIAGAIVAFACVGGGCTPRGGAGAGANPTDAAVTFQSSLVTNPATWNSLYGSWPAGRFDHGMAYDSDLKRIVVFGGRAAAAGPYFSDLWEWDTVKGAWNQRAPGGCVPVSTCPYERSQPAMFYDPVRKKTVMFSGWQPGAGFYHPDQWEWDGAAQTWTSRQLTTQPSARFGASVAWDSGRGRAVLFGGFDEVTGRRQDTWEWDGSAWTDKTPAGTKPSPRHSAQMVYDAGRGKTVLYSGNTGTGLATAGTWVDELWEWDGATSTWTKITVTAISSSQYGGGYPSMVYDASRSKIVLYYYYAATNNSYVWEYNPGTGATGTWTNANPTPTKVDTAIPPYYNAGLVYDSGRQVMALFGGQTYGRAMWELNGADFTFVNRSAPANGPIQRQYPSMAFDSMNGKLYVFGGRSSADNLYKQDIWEWSGVDATLTNRTTGGTKPDARYQSAMVYDSKRDRMLLFGGTGTATYDDLWSWSPTTREWTQITFTGTRPTARYGHWMFYDAVRDKVYVYGQYQSGFTIWEYDPDPGVNKWKDRTVTSPPAGVSRSYFDVGFDSVRGKIVEVGGYYGSAYNMDIWEWDTTDGTWAQRMPAAGSPVPDGRQYPTVAYDSIRRVMLATGGYVSITGRTEYTNESWEWDANLNTWTETTPPGVKPAPRYQHLMMFDGVRGVTYLFGGTVSSDTTYGPGEFWEYIPNSAKRPNGAGCSSGMPSACNSGFCVDGVCCAVATCDGTCKSCNVAGMAGTCANVPAGLGDNSCPSDQACNASQQCKKPLGQQCSAFADCASGHCSDGVCCDSDCNETCKICNLSAKRGTCSFVPTGDEDPTGAPACASIPDQGRSCDGAGNCANQAKAIGKPCTAGGQCQSGFCIDGVCCNSQCAQTCYQCDRSGAVGTCAAVLIGQVDHSAATPCDGASQYCNGSGTCAMNKKANGETCQLAADCGSGYCVDATCCASACTSTCQSCGVAGQLGKCVNLPPGFQDTNSTPACAGAQYCDAAGTCQTGLKPNGATCSVGTECGSTFCVDGVCCGNTCTAACYTCNGSVPGTCEGVQTGFADPACAANQYCTAAHVCTAGKKPNGAVCVGDVECGSGYCVDGTCCESICLGDCRTCANATGTCAPVADGMDPRQKCRGEGVCTGACNGQGACRWGPGGTVCQQAGCQESTGLITLGGKCDGAGHCAADPDPNKMCNGFGCFTDTGGMAQCRTDCTRDPECQLKRYCLEGTDGGVSASCPPAFDLGHACARNTQCLSGTCSDGVCCNINCDQCGSCNLPATLGTCVPVPAGTDPNGDCINSASDPSGKCGGMCDGHAKCLFPAAGTSCGTCKACNGVGLCSVTPEDDSACGILDCDGLDNLPCLDYQDIQVRRCGGLGACKQGNNAQTCTIFTNSCTTGTGGTGGGSGGRGGGGGSSGSGSGGNSSAGSAGNSGSAGNTSAAGNTGNTGNGGNTAGGGNTGTGSGGSSAGTAGKTGTAGRGGSAGGGGGGCCAIGATDSPNALVGLLVLASGMIVRRRRK